MTTETLPATTTQSPAADIPAVASQPMLKIDASADDPGSGFNSERGFALIQRAAKLLSQSTLVPKDYQNNIPNCVIALNMAQRIGCDPLMTMQNLYVVHGRPAWSAQFLIATFNQCGRFSAIRYEWVGKEGTECWGCRAWAVEKSTGERLCGSTITIGLAKEEKWIDKPGSKWKTMPQQMLMYRAASWFVRAYAPELAMGLHTVDEVDDFGAHADEPVTTTKRRAKPSKLNEPAETPSSEEVKS